jgi:hypothetical protein
MQDNLKDILSHLSTEVDQETLLLYLQGKLSDEQQHAVEEKMMENEFTADAFEGLLSMKDQHRIQHLVDQLNEDLRKKTNKKAAFREKLKLKQEPWTLVAIVLVLLCIIMGYIVIKYYLQSK